MAFVALDSAWAGPLQFKPNLKTSRLLAFTRHKLLSASLPKSASHLLPILSPFGSLWFSRAY